MLLSKSAFLIFLAFCLNAVSGAVMAQTNTSVVNNGQPITSCSGQPDGTKFGGALCCGGNMWMDSPVCPVLEITVAQTSVHGDPATNCYNVGLLPTVQTVDVFLVPIKGGNCNGADISKLAVNVFLNRIDERIQYVRGDSIMVQQVRLGDVVTVATKPGASYTAFANLGLGNGLPNYSPLLPGTAVEPQHEEIGVIDFTGKLAGKPEFSRLPLVRPVDHPFVYPTSFSFSGRFAGTTTGTIFTFDSEGKRTDFGKVTFGEGSGESFLIDIGTDPTKVGAVFGTFVDEKGLSFTGMIFNPRNM